MANQENKDLEKQAEEIIKIAAESGVSSNFLFRTTFQRYLRQVRNANRIEEKLKTLEDDKILVTKSYQKGAENPYINPLISQFDRTTDSANKTVNTLMKIIREFKVGDDKEKHEDPLVKLINGGDDDGDDEDDD